MRRRPWADEQRCLQVLRSAAFFYTECWNSCCEIMPESHSRRARGARHERRTGIPGRARDKLYGKTGLKVEHFKIKQVRWDPETCTHRYHALLAAKEGQGTCCTRPEHQKVSNRIAFSDRNSASRVVKARLN